MGVEAVLQKHSYRLCLLVTLKHFSLINVTNTMAT